ncbi:uncharacterized protein DSM5745_02073 [Aspergillus mulundensis]|uniref:Glycosyl hydrolase family 13 catalytic domain-containing protein n=1 Tax=Aspergillus mulundensis TaxID=1810919 RepID=A0A3D8SWZ3_9EURO|nr:hypothetical protein DSM5745_02073 [Aspergillus mulundensis]RDW90298.1 hypothetical protein DSM5745_02073 [Aspergillus mulundensis]
MGREITVSNKIDLCTPLRNEKKQARPDNSSDEPCDPYIYCWGSWTGIIDKLDYIQDFGFTAVQTSPVVEKIPDDTVHGEAYHGYWPQNMYALNEHFGTADELRRLFKELHKRGMYLMVDVVINDMAQAVNNSTTDDGEPSINWSRLIPFNDEKYYHPFFKIQTLTKRSLIRPRAAHERPIRAVQPRNALENIVPHPRPSLQYHSNAQQAPQPRNPPRQALRLNHT